MILDTIPRTPSGKALVADLQALAKQRSTPTSRDGRAFNEDVLALAAEVFNCPTDDLSLASEPKTTIGWDSFAHVQLILEAEKRYDITIPPRDFLGIKSLGDLVGLLEKTCGKTA